MGSHRDSTPAHGLILVPQPPQKHIITMGENGCEGRPTLVFPYHLFCIFYTYHDNVGFYLSRLHVPFSQKPFTGENPDEQFYGLPLRNHEAAHAICFYQWPCHQDKETFVRLVIQQYWSSPFMEYFDNFSYWNQIYDAMNTGFLSRWIENTKAKNHKWIMEQKLLQPPYMVSLGKLLESNKSQVSPRGVEVLCLTETRAIPRV